MPVYFVNNGHLDLDFLRLMGVSVKDDSAIGQFGTGLKYAIATLLRLNCKIRLYIGDEQYEFFTDEKVLRGATFRTVCLRSGDYTERLGFTTDLGKNWTAEMAYRELASNAFDEGGDVFDSTNACESHQTMFSVRGEAIDKARMAHSEIFLTTPILSNGNAADLHEGETDKIYYRGVKVGTVPFLSEPLSMTYNIHKPLTLTEDRTYASGMQVASAIRDFIVKEATKEQLHRILLRKKCMEHGFDYAIPLEVSATFLDFLEAHKSNAYIAETAERVLRKWRPSNEPVKEPDLATSEERKIREALQLLRPLVEIKRTDFKVLESLGDGTVMGQYNRETGEMLISRQALLKGPRYIAETIFEEHTHKATGFSDCTRALQDHLFERLIDLAEEYNIATAGKE